MVRKKNYRVNEADKTYEIAIGSYNRQKEIQHFANLLKKHPGDLVFHLIHLRHARGKADEYFELAKKINSVEEFIKNGVDKNGVKE